MSKTVKSIIVVAIFLLSLFGTIYFIDRSTIGAVISGAIFIGSIVYYGTSSNKW